jgi:hypothetical protein
MKLKVVVVDLEIPPGVKKWALRLGIPVAVLLGGGGVALAAGLVTWSSGQTLQAADLNNNFTYLSGEISALQSSQSALQSSVSTLQTSVSTLQSSMSTVQANVSTLQTEAFHGVYISTNCEQLTYQSNGFSYSACFCNSGDIAISGSANAGLNQAPAAVGLTGGGGANEMDMNCRNTNTGASIPCLSPGILCLRSS